MQFFTHCIHCDALWIFTFGFYMRNIYIFIYDMPYSAFSMLVILHSGQLESIIKQSIHDIFELVPENLHLDSRYLLKNQDCWEVSAEFDSGGAHHNMRLRINPRTGRIIRITKNGDTCSPSGG